MEKQKQEFNLFVIGEKIQSASNRNAFKEQIVLNRDEQLQTWDYIYAIRKEYGHLINSIWLHDDFIIIYVAPAGAISWCELIDRRTNKKNNE